MTYSRTAQPFPPCHNARWDLGTMAKPDCLGDALYSHRLPPKVRALPWPAKWQVSTVFSVFTQVFQKLRIIP